MSRHSYLFSPLLDILRRLKDLDFLDWDWLLHFEETFVHLFIISNLSAIKLRMRREPRIYWIKCGVDVCAPA